MTTATTTTAARSSGCGVPRAPMATTALDLLDRSRASLLDACRAGTVDERYVDAHLAALRAAAALLAARSRPTRRSRPRSVWEVLPEVAPELTEWAVFFAASARRRAAIERGAVALPTREADDLLRQAEVFLGLVQAALGLPVAATLPALVTPAGRP
ncbi:SAV_6107 family HEPN domain-containing protein [Oryzihumus leptocrescens]|uniref:SAV-6107-like HEPN domain-containing protein n=1 Tax=Oryzihumus leptocrescens TaxID=297536 RepID=A0A542ZJK3_9MICO|nr:SAV_6107 family HEPN domain-containing protein [Oryzihumus leptocrescens]TQL60527.1 hypothetical protein FB474_1922 [Oryzihumus leptocrescens]